MPEKKKAVIADDMEGNRKLIKAFLHFAGFETDLASDGLEATKLLGAAKYDLLVSDIEMPNMNGFELLAWTRRNASSATMPVIMLSSLESAEVIERCRKLGASAYIVKPFTKEKLEEALAKAGL